MLGKVEKLLKKYNSRKKFFTLVEKWLSKYSEEYKKIERAYDDAKDAFRETSREDGDRYFEHIRAVAIIIIAYLYIFERRDLTIESYKIVIAAILHDIVEDCDEWSLDRVEREYDEEIALILDYVTKRPVEEFGGSKERALAFYHNRMRVEGVNTAVFLVKLADRLHNMITLWSCSKEKIKRKICETRDIYIPLAREHGILSQELAAASRRLSKKYPV